MTRGGIETWLMRVLRAIDRERVRMDFLVPTTEPAAYDEEIRALGSQVIPGPSHRRPLGFASGVRRILRETGPWDVVHSHLSHVSGLVLRAARAEAVPIRIAHSHNDRRTAHLQSGPVKRAYVALTRVLVHRHATAGFGCSVAAAEWLFGNRWQEDGRWRVLRYGLDLTPFGQEVDGAQVRGELGLGEDDLVIGHVGNFRAQKNHPFLVRIAAETVRQEPRAHFLLLGRDVDGTGEMREAVAKQAAAAGIADRVHFLGERSDVPRLLLGAMDAFILPSLYEGLPNSVLEAQAAGLRCVVSDAVTREVEVGRGLVRRLPLSAPAADWAAAVLRAADEGAGTARQQARRLVAQSWLNITGSVAELEATYGV